MEKKINIAIDGYSSSGKSSLARAISKEFKMKYIDTGAMYRAITYLLLKNSIDSSNFVESEKKVDELINNCKIEYNYNFKKNISETILNGAICDEHIRKNYVSEFVSIVSKSKKVRDFMIAKQKKIASNKNVVMDGRDIGTIVFPEAECKFFLVANVEVRAKRRYFEQQSKDNKETYEKVLKSLIKRDKLDTDRISSPLREAKGAFKIDVSDLTLDEVYDKMLSYIKKKLNKH